MSDLSQPIKVKGLRGKVTKAKYGRGSKSERLALFMENSEGRYLLRRKAGPAFSDPDFGRYLGCIVECDGFRIGNTLLADQIRLVSKSRKA